MEVADSAECVAYNPIAEGIAAVGMCVAVFKQRGAITRTKASFEAARRRISHLAINPNDLGPSHCSNIARGPRSTPPRLDLRGMIRLGNGLHAPTYYGSYKGEVDVTIKLAQFKTAAPFLNEVLCLEAVAGHRNIVRLIGTHMEWPLETAMVYTYAEGVPLHRLCKERKTVLSERTQWTIALGVADAMAHVHAKNVIHRDLKSMNVIVKVMKKDEVASRANRSGYGAVRAKGRNKRYHVQLIDFGSATRLPAGHGDWWAWDAAVAPHEKKPDPMLTYGVGTFDYMAPEMWSEVSPYGKEVDVYAFAMILYELATLRLPWSNEPPEDVIAFHESLKKDITNGHRPPIPASVHPLTADLIKRCWSQDPKMRPAFTVIMRELQCGLATAEKEFLAERLMRERRGEKEEEEDDEEDIPEEILLSDELKDRLRIKHDSTATAISNLGKRLLSAAAQPAKMVSL
ncbi:Serine/threonine-protein kinase HT1 [Diplonema papillatum]|nr:Serine/threonine-protein kinase HT1 [Diplonema papillatum]|eukprot:gene9110-14114_t